MSLLPRLRRLVARRPWIQWVLIAIVAAVVAASVNDAVAELERERGEWGTSATVWIASRNAAAGDPIAAERAEVPAAVRPDGAIDAGEAVHDAIARQAIGRGEIVVDHDVMTTDGSLAPTGWLVVPVEESPPSGATLGERVQVASDGFVLADEGMVVGFVEGATLVAVPDDVAPLLTAATSARHHTLLRMP